MHDRFEPRENRAVIICLPRGTEPHGCGPVGREGSGVKAIVHTRYGSPDVLQLREVEKPVPNDDEVLVNVRATTVNRTDCGILRGKPFIIRIFYGLRKPKRTILGTEFAGRVEATGKDVTSFQVGDDVFGYNDAVAGAHAEYKTMREDDMLTIMPVNTTYEEAAPAAEGAHYALKDIRKAEVVAGQSVLVIGASGAIGSAAVQLLKHFGAHVTAVCGTRNVELVASLGADHVIDYSRQDFTRGGKRYDLVYDAVGKSSFGACRRLLKRHGVYCSSELGLLAQNPLLASWTSLFGRRRVVFAVPRSSKDDLILLKELIEGGTLRPVVDRRYPLEQVAEAFRYVETGRKTGNVVITVKHYDDM